MALSILASFASLALLAISCSAQQVFDVTKYGAVGDGTSHATLGFIKAWREACDFDGRATFLVPKGSFLVGPLVFAGPCEGGNGSVSIQIEGTLLAPSDPDRILSIGWLEFRELTGLTMAGGGTIDGQGADSWKLRDSGKEDKILPISVRLIKVTNVTVSDLNILNSKGVHFAIHMSSYVTLRNLHITAPGDSPNTDGVHISGSEGVDIEGLTIATGDDCISIGQGTTNLAISGVTCGPGHGISVGSLGKYDDEEDVSGVSVKNCTVSDTLNGVRIKTWPGSSPSAATNVTFEDIILVNVSNPIIVDQVYCPSGSCSGKASQVKIKDVTFRNIRGTSSSPVAVKLLCSESTPCENVQFEDINIEAAPSCEAKVTTSSCSNVKGGILGKILSPVLCL